MGVSPVTDHSPVLQDRGIENIPKGEKYEEE